MMFPNIVKWIRESGPYFRTSDWKDLRDKMQYLVDNPEAVKEYQLKAVARIKEAYTWDRISDNYETLFLKMNGGGNGKKID